MLREVGANGAAGIHFDDLATNIRGRVYSRLWPMSGLYSTSSQEYVEGDGPGSPKSEPQANIFVPRAAYSQALGAKRYDQRQGGKGWVGFLLHAAEPCDQDGRVFECCGTY
jgi:hypothetical protein